MSVKDHSLDEKIVKAATYEFLDNGFQGASLRKIAQRAGLTTGALYTRYKNKDVLFCSLVETAFKEIYEELEPLNSSYIEAQASKDPLKIMEAIKNEEKIYLELMFKHYDECILFFCRSEGSSVQKKLKLMMEEKAKQTLSYLKSIAKKDASLDGIEMIISEQFNYYRQVLQKGYSKEKAISCMKTVEAFMEAGWKDLFERIM